jgi:hypothetical protein
MAGAALVISLAALALAIGHKYLDIDPQNRFHVLVYTDLTKSGIDLKTAESDKFLDVTLILIGTLAGLILAKPEEAKVTLEDKPELIMFVSALLLLLSSVMCHQFYLSAVSNVFLEARMDRANTSLSLNVEPTQDWKTEAAVVPSQPDTPYSIESQLTLEDVRDPAVEYLLKGQIWFLLSGAILSIMALVSANLLKESAIVSG